jgi:hypothetical protein
MHTLRSPGLDTSSAFLLPVLRIGNTTGSVSGVALGEGLGTAGSGAAMQLGTGGRMVSLARDITPNPNLVYHSGINPLVRSILRDQGHWNGDRLEARLREGLQEDEESGKNLLTQEDR